MNVWECRTELSNAWKCITAIASLVGLSGAQINRGVRGEKQNSRWVPKRICDGSCIFRISLNQCAYKAISSTALSTITILKKTSFHDSLKFILSDSQELPNLWCLCKYGFFFFKWHDIQNIWKPCREILHNWKLCRNEKVEAIHQ